MPITHRLYNFSAGPAVLPMTVLEQMQRELVALPNVGMSVLEISHRSKVFESIIGQAESDIRRLAGIPDSYRILFLQGGASLQFSMVPMNLLGEGGVADYLDAGSWAAKAIEEARKVGRVHIAASSKNDGYKHIPNQGEMSFSPDAAYVHITANNTIEGTEYKRLPDVGAPLISDSSSDLFSRPIDVARHGLIYAGAQKNLGPAGVTLVIVRDDLVARAAARKASMSAMLNYAVHAEHHSLYNTPPAFAVYAMGLVVKWILGQGGLAAMATVNERKAGALYAEIDRTGFYRGTAAVADRSLMNVTFRLASEDLETRFLTETTAAGLDGLKGHRAVGGMRASLYNAFPEDGVQALVDFMKEFERKHG